MLSTLMKITSFECIEGYTGHLTGYAVNFECGHFFSLDEQ